MRGTLHITGDETADGLLDADPNAFLIGMLPGRVRARKTAQTDKQDQPVG